MSKNRLKLTNIVNETKEIPKLEVVDKKAGYLNYGLDNYFPNYLLELYYNSSQMASIISTMVDYVIGDDVINNTSLEFVNKRGDTFKDFIKRITFDYILFGGYAFQIIRNGFGEVAELYWMDFKNVRVNEDEDMIYYNKDWKKRKTTTKVFDRYKIGVKNPNSVYYYKGELTRNQYPMPMYYSALTSIEVSTQIANYNLHNITNNFTPSAIINVFSDGGLSEDVQAEMEQLVIDKFGGTSNAGNILISFNDNPDNKTTIDRLADDGLQDKFNILADSVKSDIYSAFRINEVLVGLNKSTGFSKTEFSEAFTLYNKTVISPMQKAIINSLEKVFGVGTIEIKPFTIDWGEEKTGEIPANDNVIS